MVVSLFASLLAGLTTQQLSRPAPDILPPRYQSEKRRSGAVVDNIQPTSARIAGNGRGAAKSPCASPQESAAVAHTIRSLFSSLARQDYAAVERLTTPSFHAFEVGKRYTRTELTKLLVDAHKAGRVFEWTIGPVEARVDCMVASANWENIGSVGTAEQRQPMTWLESATLVRDGDRWLIDFLHSTPKDPRK